MNNNAETVVNMALFIDIENLIGSASTLAIPIDLGPVLQKLKEQGRILIRRCYGDIKNCLIHVGRSKLEDQTRKMLMKNLVQIEDIPYMTTSKNTADMRLVVDALSEAFTNSTITHFVVLSSDRDYVPLYNKLHELNKTIIAVVVDRMNVNPMVIEAVDKVEYYETLFAKETVDSKESPTPDSSIVEGERKRLRDNYFRLLQNAIRTLEKKQIRPLGSKVYPMMLQLQSDFDPSIIGLASFKEFVQVAEREKSVTVDWGDNTGDFTMLLGDHQTDLPVSQSDSRESLGDAKKIVKAYRKFLEDKLKVQFPTREQRERVFERAEETRARLSKEGPYSLVEWKDAVLRDSGHVLDEHLVYKMLLSLHYARCFYCEAGSSQTNPNIVGLKVSKDQWDLAVVANFCRQMMTETKWGRLSPEALAKLFYGEDPDGKDRIEELLLSL